ncbi:MAG: hypothetical protein ACKO55_10740, partial [Bacteroidota bacterium]
NSLMQAPLYQPDDTIVAPLSPAGQGAVCLVRVSGPLSKVVVSHLTHKPVHAVSWPARTVRLVALWDGDALLDRALVTTFDAPASYTGEDCAEWGHNGVIRLVQRCLHEAVFREIANEICLTTMKFV